MESLLAGDIDSFFEAQATQGAVSAIAAGNAGDFDADTLYKAYEEIKRQAQAGVTEIDGQKIQGPGGLLERAATATAEARGLDPAQAAMVAQGATGQTPAEQAANAEIQQLAATLPAFGDMAMNAAQEQIKAAEAQKQAAEVQKLAANAQSAQNSNQNIPAPAVNRASGGPIYASRGRLINFVPRGTDTVPAMLTPGEFVVNRQAVQRGNNLSLLQAMNKGSRVAASAPASMNRGGVVYRAAGSTSPERSSSGGSMGFDSSAMSDFTNALNKFNETILQSINTLQSTKFMIQLEPTNININLTGTSFLQTLTSELQNNLLSMVSQRLRNLKVDSSGRVTESNSNLS